MIREIHGVVARVTDQPAETQHVRITDCADGISLVHTHSCSAFLSAEEARFIAKQLMLAARRLEARIKK
jgi:hypothetical protein